MEERSLRITGADKTFFNKITNTLTKILIPTQIGINGMLISIKRNSVIKAFENYTLDDGNYDKEELEKKYDTAYEAYIPPCVRRTAQTAVAGPVAASRQFGPRGQSVCTYPACSG